MTLKRCRYANLLDVEYKRRINLGGVISLDFELNFAPLRVFVTYIEPSDYVGTYSLARNYDCSQFPLLPVHMKLFPTVSVARRRELYDVMTQPVYGQIINYCYISDTKRILNVICGSYIRTLYPQMVFYPLPAITLVPKALWI